MRTLQCQFCNQSFEREDQPGRPPTTCSDEHRRALAVQRSVEWQQAHPDRDKAIRSRAWAKHYARNRKAMIARSVEYQRTHPEKKRARDSAYYARTRGSSDAELFTLDEIYERDEAMCHLCDEAVERPQASIDHVVPASLGGPHTRANVKLAHRSCNSSRKTMPVQQYRARRLALV